MDAVRRSWWRVVPWALLVAMLGVTPLVDLEPEWNLDGVFYAAAARKPDAPSSAALHTATYREVAEVVPPEPRRALEEGSSFRYTLRQDPEAFARQLPFYEVKPLYIGLVRAFHRAGLPALRAAHLVPVLSWFAIGLVIAAASARVCRSAVLACAGAAALLITPALTELATLATPDALCALLLVAGAWALYLRPPVGGVLLVLAVAARPDASLFAGPLLLAWLSLEPSRRRLVVALAIGAALLGTALASTYLLGGYGWAATMRQTFLSTTSEIHRLREPLHWSEYLTALRVGMSGHMTARPFGFVPYVVVAALSVVLARRAASPRPEAVAAMRFCLAAWAGVVIHVLAFPLLADRLFASAYVLTLPVAVLAITVTRGASR